MKKSFIVCMLVALSQISCSSDDDGKSCDSRIYELESTCAPDANGDNCVYTVTYGPSESETTTVSINEATYTLYEEEFMEGQTCWEGPVFGISTTAL